MNGGALINLPLDQARTAKSTNAFRHRVTIAPGTSATPAGDGRTHVRLCFDRPSIELEAAVARLGRAVEDTTGRRRSLP